MFPTLFFLTAQYRKLLQMRDAWNRSIIEHAIESGRHVIFEEVFTALREDVYDEEVGTGSASLRLDFCGLGSSN